MVISGIFIVFITIFFITVLVYYNILIKLKKDIEKQRQNWKYFSQQNTNVLKSIGQNRVRKQDLIQSIEQKTKEKEKIIQETKQVLDLYNLKSKEYRELNQIIINTKKQADQVYEEEKQKINNRVEEFKKTAQESASHYFDNLEKVYQTAEAGHAEKMTRLKEEMDGAAAQLQKLQDTRKAAHDALLRQKQIKENKDNYRLLPSPLDIEDLTALRHVKSALHKPRILSMLIWQTYFQPLAKEKFPIILQDKTKIGIYKITNLRTEECYIGQSVDIYKRWTDHCKAGLGIDTPVGNKLYKAMQEDELYNFTFQLLCECPKQELDEKEKYFINLYQADLYGYNSQKGNK